MSASFIINLIVLISPFIVAYSTYKIGRKDRADKKKENKYHFIIYIASTVIIISNIISWLMNENESKIKDSKISELLSQNTKLLDGNTNLFSGNQELFKGQKSLLDQNIKISEQNLKMARKVDELKTILSQKDSTIINLQTQVKKLQVTSPKIDLNGMIIPTPGISYRSEYSEGIKKARNLLKEGKVDEAYNLAQNLSQKNSDFGLPYAIMGAVKSYQGYYDEAEQLLLKCIKLGIPKEDLPYTYYDLGLIAMNKNNYNKAYEYINKSLLLNPKIDIKDAHETLNYLKAKVSK